MQIVFDRLAIAEQESVGQSGPEWFQSSRDRIAMASTPPSAAIALAALFARLGRLRQLRGLLIHHLSGRLRGRLSRPMLPVAAL
jgi:hypothetical protein